MKVSFFAILLTLWSFQMHTAQAQAISHEAWNALLIKYVTATGQVNYAGFKTDKAKLDAYLKTLSAGVAANASKQEKMAFWINAYNAFTVKLIVDNYPTNSIKDLKGGKPWDAKFISIGGKTYSLNDIEHEILRKQYFDARLHFVLVCAAKSCPKLLNKAYTAANLETEMENQAKYFINNTAKNKITASSAQLSELFNWYKDDFTKQGTLIAFLNKYSKVKLNANAKITNLTYDWSLNK